MVRLSNYYTISSTLCAILLGTADAFAFQPSLTSSSIFKQYRPTNALASSKLDTDESISSPPPTTTTNNPISTQLQKVTQALLLTATILTTATTPSHAVSGGGLDYAGLDISNQDFSNSKQYKGKDFTQTIAKAADFSRSNLQGCRFYKAYLVNAKFVGSDLRGASLEDTSMDNADLTDVLAGGAYFGASLVDVKSLENGDFTDAQIPVKTLMRVCERDDVKGTNPVTGVDTRDSLMCL